MRAILGLLVFMGLAWAISENRKQIPFREIGVGLGLQFGLMFVMFKVPAFQTMLLGLNQVVMVLDKATTAGTTFVFGYLGGGDLPFDPSNPAATFVLAFKALPLILVVSALSSVLFYWRILPVVVNLFAKVLQKTMNIGGALGVGTAANIFIGMVESPALIRPYLAKMTRSELFALMSVGMATVAGTVMFLYASILSPTMPNALGHILAASICSAPAALIMARLMVPETGPQTEGIVAPDQEVHSTLDAITQGTTIGLKLLLQVVAMLLVLVALVNLTNQILAILPLVGDAPITLERTLGWIMQPIVWLMGVPWEETQVAGMLMGTKTILNEFLAYLTMAGIGEDQLSQPSRIIMTYAMCGFANLGSLGIMMGGLTALVPQRRTEFTQLGMRSIVSGTLATCMTGAIAGLVL